MDLDDMALEALEDLRERVTARIEHLRLVGQVPEQIRVLVTNLLEATGREMGAPWAAPSGAHDAFPAGWVVTHGGKTWESLVAGNVWEPGDPNDPQNYRWWRDLTAASDDGAWDGNGHTYAVGDRVTFEGAEYECRQAHTSQPDWTPAAVPALWLAV